ncbi:OLC1v1020619C1 [Oldenlandia corymbosa var. corymbosa]|uniref:OLC1v1020619C1 n=1 Tax=Oldenlandia corymbosa var. corymbosa TaxID=529605 RepID=A0AAV1EGS7_OLDCO|nr:OLC1v1020619C1 [Oldenlandia corymbosa var. corymbosa]
MDFLSDQAILRGMMDYEQSAMEIVADQSEQKEAADVEEQDEDPFIKFIDFAQTMLSENEKENSNRPGWSWTASRILKTCSAYSSGVTPAILLSDLSQAWSEQNRVRAPKKRPDYVNKMREKHKRAKLPDTVTIDSIYEKRFLSLASVIEAVILDVYTLPGTNIYMITLGDFWSSNTIDLYLHRRFYKLVDPINGILRKGREVLLTGCHLRTASGSSAQSRLLPTENFIVLLDEDQDDDAMLLGAQFCSDSFSSISLEAINEGVSYSLYARIEAIGSLETQGKHCLQRKQIILVDNDDVKATFLLWGDQPLLSVGSMLALDRPFIASSPDCALETCETFCLEYGSETQLYLVPFLQHEEHVSVALTQSRSQGSRFIPMSEPSQGSVVSQVSLPCDSQGSMDFSHYPFRSFVADVRGKMTSISLFGVVSNIVRDTHTASSTFYLEINDRTGTIWIKLHFVRSWSVGRVSLGHTVYISGLMSSTSKNNRVELSWVENESGASFMNLSCLPALLNSSCLHKLSCLSDLELQTGITHICRVWLDHIEHVNTRFLHSACGNFIENEPGDIFCTFCNRNCSGEVVRSFHMKITLADESTKIQGWCIGQTAAELLQIFPDEFDALPEEEQIIYPSALENERFTVAIVNCKGQASMMDSEHYTTAWEITRATKL